MAEDKNKTQDLDQTDDQTNDVQEEVAQEEPVSEEAEEVGAEEIEAETEEVVEEAVGEEAEEEEVTEEATETEEAAGTKDMPSDSLIIINDDVPENAKWYVVNTYSGHERKVAELINARVLGRAYQDRIFKILIPTQEKIVVSEGKKRKIDEKLFPGYIVVNMIMGDEASYLIRSTQGVTSFISAGNKPLQLPQHEVDGLIKYMTQEAPKFETKFREGDSVKINDGPFMDFLGKVDEVNEDQGKARVLVSVFGRETPVELDFTQISSI